jgi:exocyst complex component 2
MALDVVKLYISLLSEFFVLSDMAVMSTATSTTPPLFPAHSNSLTTAHYFMKMVGEIQETISEIDTMDISSEAAGGVRNLLESARWKFVDLLTLAWQRGGWTVAVMSSLHADMFLSDANIFYFLEAWVSSSSEPNATAYMFQIQAFQRQITTAAFKISGGVDLSGALSASRPLKQYPVAPAFQAKIVKAFLDALYAMLDGLVHLASKESPIVSGKKMMTVDTSATGKANRLDLVDLMNDVSSGQARQACSLTLGAGRKDVTRDF